MSPTSAGSYLSQIPPADRKSGIPDSVLMPAPVSTTHGRRRSSSSVSLATLTCQRYASPLVGKCTGEEQQADGEERAHAPDRLEVRQVDEEDLADREHQNAQAAETQRAPVLREPGEDRGEAERRPEAGESELRRLRRVTGRCAREVDDEAARQVDAEPGGDPGERL